MFMSNDQFYDSSDEEDDEKRALSTEEEKKMYTPAFAAFVEKTGKDKVLVQSSVRPVSARAYRKSGSSAGPVRMFDNDLFGDDGDVLAAADNESSSLNTPSQPKDCPSRRLQSPQNRQKITAAERRRFERLKGGICVSSTSLVPARPDPGHDAFGSGEIGAFKGISGHSETMNNHNSSREIPELDEISSTEKSLQPKEIGTILGPTATPLFPMSNISQDRLKLRFEVSEAASREDRENFLSAPGPRTSPILCFIVRDRNESKMYPKYSLYLDEGGKFLLSSRKRKKSKSSNYLISLDDDDLNRESPNYFGKVRSNFLGTEFIMFDHGSKPAKSTKLARDNGEKTAERMELGGVVYQHNVLGTRGPRRMTALLPAVDCETETRVKFANDRTIVDRFKASEQLEDMVILKNKIPKWNEQLNAYCLNFKGRVTEASVKNFQLVTDEDPENVILQFGKVGLQMLSKKYSCTTEFCVERFSASQQIIEWNSEPMAIVICDTTVKFVHVCILSAF